MSFWLAEVELSEGKVVEVSTSTDITEPQIIANDTGKSVGTAPLTRSQ